MKEYWVNVYEWGLGLNKWARYNSAVEMAGSKIHYRLHVKMKEKKRYHHSYSFGWDKNLNCATNRC